MKSPNVTVIIGKRAIKIKGTEYAGAHYDGAITLAIFKFRQLDAFSPIEKIKVIED